MKKLGVFVVLFLLLFGVTTVLAAAGDDCESNSDCEPGETCQDSECAIETTDDTTDTTTSPQQDETKGIEKGFECLEEKAKDCSSLSNQEIALTILATPDNIFDDCVKELESRKKSNNWKNNVKDTAMAILALKHAGKDTEASEEWLMSQNRTPTELTWYLQQDSNEEVSCHIAYESSPDNTITIGKNKKINKNAGSCLTRAQSDFWLQVSPSCFDQEFTIECDKDFIATLLYKNKQSSTFYILEGTESAPGLTGQIKLRVKSKCFGQGSCDYESTAWATLALLETRHNVEDYIPYVIAMSDTNERYLPEAFIYMLTNYEDYATQLITARKLGNYWEAKQSANNKFYDTSLALIALGSSSAEQITKSRAWLLFSQSKTTGCWNNKVKDTAIVLWALSGRAGRTSTGSGVTRCAEADFFCIPKDECVLGEDVGNNYFCGIGQTSCCTNENLKSCSEYNGERCATDKTCNGNSRKATDALDGDCCTGTCEDRPTETECVENYYTCMDTCSEFQEPVASYSCDGIEVCCKTKTADDDRGSSIWIWILIILILIVAGVIGWIKREQLKLFLFKIKTRFKKDKGKGAGPSAPIRPGPRGPPRPGFPPIRRPSPPVAQMRRQPPHKDTAMSETFKKLREMSK